MTKPNVITEIKPLGGLENCRVVDIGVEKFAECLQQGPCPCSYALPFGSCFLCNHPRVNEIIENSKKSGTYLGVPKY